MWLVALTTWGDHNVSLPILTGCLTCLLVFCDWFCGWFFSRWPPHIFLFSWSKNLLKISSGLGVIIGYSSFTNFGVLDFSRVDSTDFGELEFSGFDRILFSCVLASSKFPFLFLFFYTRAFSFFMDPVLFLFLFFLFIPTRWHLTLVTRALASDVSFLWIWILYIDVVPDVVIWTVNWLHYLNYEVIIRTSSNCI